MRPETTVLKKHFIKCSVLAFVVQRHHQRLRRMGLQRYICTKMAMKIC